MVPFVAAMPIARFGAIYTRYSDSKYGQTNIWNLDSPSKARYTLPTEHPQDNTKLAVPMIFSTTTQIWLGETDHLIPIYSDGRN